jgi:hypothetical protein
MSAAEECNRFRDENCENFCHLVGNETGFQEIPAGKPRKNTRSEKLKNVEIYACKAFFWVLLL